MNKEEINAENAKREAAAKLELLDGLKEIVPNLENAQSLVLMMRSKGGKKHTLVFGEIQEVVMLVGANCHKSPQIGAMFQTAVETASLCALGEKVLTQKEEMEMAGSDANKTENEKTAG